MMADCTEPVKVSQDELEFFTDMAMNECQRWLEGVTQERFIDEDDFLYSLRHGTQLRKVINQILPGAFRLGDSDTSDSLSDFDVVFSEEFENWVKRFVRICWKELQISPRYLLRVGDLDAQIDEATRQGRLTDQQTLAKVRRVVVTVDQLAHSFDTTFTRGPRFDRSAVDSLLNYHQCVSADEPWRDPLGDRAKDVSATLETILRNVCSLEDINRQSSPSTSGVFTSEQLSPAPISMDPVVNEKVSKYLADLPADDLCETMSSSDYGAYSHSTRSSSPAFDSERSNVRRDNQRIPTRFTEVKTTACAHPNPLQFVAGKTRAVGLAEQAKEQLRKVEEMSKLKQEMKKIEEEEGNNWQSNLDSWKNKRRNMSSNVLRDQVEKKEQLSKNASLEAISPSKELADGPFRKSSLDPALLKRQEQTHSLGAPQQQISESLLRSAIHQKTTKSLTQASMEDSGHFEAEESNQNGRRGSYSSVEEDKLEAAVNDQPVVEPIVKKVTVEKKDYIGVPAAYDSGMETTRESLSPGRESQSSLSPQSHTTSESEELYSNSTNTKQPSKVEQQPKWKFQQVQPTVEDILVTIEQRPHADKGFGFTVSGGKSKHQAVIVEGVIFGSAADKAKLQVGDEVLRINGETVSDKYLPKINHIIHEAQRLGEVELLVRRQHHGGSSKTMETEEQQRAPSPQQTDLGFDRKRSLFDKTPEVDQYYRFRQSRRPAERHWNTPAMRNPGAGASINRRLETPAADPFLTLRRISPGRIENFVPEAERERSPSPVGQRADYRVTSLQETRPVGKLSDFVPEVERSDMSGSVSPCSRDANDSRASNDSKGTKLLRNYDLGILSASDALSDRKSESECSDRSWAEKRRQNSQCEESMKQTLVEQQQTEAPQLNNDDSAKSFLGLKLQRMAVTRRIREGINKARCRFLGLRSEEEQPPPCTSDYVDLSVYRRWDKQREAFTQAQQILDNPRDYYFDSPRRFTYDESCRPQRVALNRHRSVLVVPIRDKNRRSDARQRYEVIQQQRMPRPESPPNKIRQSRPFGHVQNSIIFSSEPVPGSQATPRTPDPVVRPPEPVLPPPKQERHQEPELAYLSLAAHSETEETRHQGNEDVREHWLMHEATQSRLSDQLNTDRRSPKPQHNGHYHNLPLQTDNNCAPRGKPQEQQQNPVASVSGRQRCSHCNEQLGKGAAMIIESLNLFYHLSCFRCYVCAATLGNGAHGADVRVRAGKLHCQSCYSNDEAGLKYSEV